MFGFEEQYQKYEALVKQVEQAYEFWTNCVVSSWKEFYGIK